MKSSLEGRMFFFSFAVMLAMFLLGLEYFIVTNPGHFIKYNGRFPKNEMNKWLEEADQVSQTQGIDVNTREEKREGEEERKKEEEQHQHQLERKEEKRKKKDEQRKRDEQAREKEEQRQKDEDQRKREEDERKKEDEQRKRDEEEREKEEQRTKDEDQRKQEEQRKREEVERKKEGEQRKRDEEKREKEEQSRKDEDSRRIEEEREKEKRKKQEEALRKKEEEEQRQKEEIQKNHQEELQRLMEEEQRKKEGELKREEEEERRKPESEEQNQDFESSQWIYRPKSVSINEILTVPGKKYVAFYHNVPESGVPEKHRMREKDFERCTISDCEWTHDAWKADMLIFEGIVMTRYPVKKLWPRPPHQQWLFTTVDPVTDNFGLENPLLRSQFNLTSSYRQRSDLPVIIGKISKNEFPRQDLNYSKIWRQKNKVAAWFVSNCNTQGKREVYVERMSKTAPVDIFGWCGPFKCGDNHNRSYDKNDCFPILTEHYKFYLAFESHMCEEYITEKFFKMYEDVQVIPVVRGAVDYNNYLPKDTFINAADFKSPEALMNHLIELGNNEEAYTKMLKAKAKWQQAPDPEINMHCQVCWFLHADTKTRIIDDVKEAFTGDPRQCHPPTDL